jgi:hypothetical protein
MKRPLTTDTKVTTADLARIRKYVRAWIKTLKESYREPYGVVREAHILTEIAYLEKCLRFLSNPASRISDHVSQ